MECGFHPFAAPEIGAIDEELEIEAGRPESAERPTEPGTGFGFFEENSRINQTGQAHEDHREADEEGVNLENGGVRGSHERTFLTPFELSRDGNVDEGEEDEAGTGDAEQGEEDFSHGG